LWLRTLQTRLLGCTSFRRVRCVQDDRKAAAHEADR